MTFKNDVLFCQRFRNYVSFLLGYHQQAQHRVNISVFYFCRNHHLNYMENLYLIIFFNGETVKMVPNGQLSLGRQVEMLA